MAFRSARALPGALLGALVPPHAARLAILRLRGQPRHPVRVQRHLEMKIMGLEMREQHLAAPHRSTERAAIPTTL